MFHYDDDFWIEWTTSLRADTGLHINNLHQQTLLADSMKIERFSLREEMKTRDVRTRNLPGQRERQGLIVAGEVAFVFLVPGVCIASGPPFGYFVVHP